MKRAKYIEKRSILSEVKYTIKAIILLPIMIVLLPFKLLSRAVFYLGHQDKYIRLDKDVYNETCPTQAPKGSPADDKHIYNESTGTRKTRRNI